MGWFKLDFKKEFKSKTFYKFINSLNEKIFTILFILILLNPMTQQV